MSGLPRFDAVQLEQAAVQVGNVAEQVVQAVCPVVRLGGRGPRGKGGEKWR